MSLSPLVFIDRYPGGDFGARAHAAHSDLGAARGILVAPPSASQSISTQFHLTGAPRKLILGQGVYTCTHDPLLYRGVIVMDDNTEVVGCGWSTVIVENDTAGNIPKQIFVEPATAAQDYAGDGPSNCRIAHLKILGAAPDYQGDVPTISLGNSHGLVIEHVYMKGTKSLGIVIGANGLDGNFASDTSVRNCRFEGVSAQNLSAVNASGFEFIDNEFISGGSEPGAFFTYLDLEPNLPQDKMDNFLISGNRFYCLNQSGRNSDAIVAQKGGRPFIGPGQITNNLIYGATFGPYGAVGGELSAAITVAGCKDVSVKGNEVVRSTQDAIAVYDSERCSVKNNTLIQCGGAAPPVRLNGSARCSVKNNDLLYYTGADQGFCLNQIVEENGSDYNVIQGNEINSFSGYRGVVVVTGAHSYEVDNTFDGVKAKCMPYADVTIAGTAPGILMKLDDTTPGNAAKHTTSDTADDVIGILWGAPTTGYDVCTVVMRGDRSTWVEALSDGTTDIDVASWIEPSATIDGHVRAGTANKIGRNAGASVASGSPGGAVTMMQV